MMNSVRKFCRGANVVGAASTAGAAAAASAPTHAVWITGVWSVGWLHREKSDIEWRFFDTFVQAYSIQQPLDTSVVGL